MLEIANRPFRRALLSLNGLAPAAESDPLPTPTSPSGPRWVSGMVRRLGFVQVDSVSAIERAHHHILFSRNHCYKQDHLVACLETQRSLFENWTHDAAILPCSHFPYWRHYFERQRRYEVHAGYKRYFDAVTDEAIEVVLRRVGGEGPLKPRDIDLKKADYGFEGFPTPTLAKVTMEYLWRTGKLAVAGRDKREKLYDLTERVIPEELFNERVERRSYLDWACRQALHRLGAARPAQIARFFEAVSTREASEWCRAQDPQELLPVRIQHADGGWSSGAAYAFASFLERLGEVPGPPRRLRLINPFDPLIHDRQRTRRIFGFDYAVEIFVPPKKRRYGYYVLPILEGERFTGRLDAKADRKTGVFNVLGLWWQDGVTPTGRRTAQLERELGRLAKFVGAPQVDFRA